MYNLTVYSKKVETPWLSLVSSLYDTEPKNRIAANILMVGAMALKYKLVLLDLKTQIANEIDRS